MPQGGRGLPAVVFNASRGTFLYNADLALPAAGSTVIAVFTDAGSPSTCCSGLFYAQGSCRGLSTSAGAGGRVSVEADWCYGTDPHGAIDVRGRAVVAAVVYGPSQTLPRNSSAASFVGGCAQTRDAAIPVASSLGFMVGSRNDELGRFFEGELHELRVYNASLSAAELEAETEDLRARWQVPPLAPDECPAPPDVGFAISQKFAMLRFLSAAQSRTSFSIVFNGQLFVANRPPRADARVWGTLDCHQNSRLAYVPLLATGDGDLHRAWLEHNLARLPLWRARTQHFFGHDGIHMTECKSPLGTPSGKHYDGSCTGSPSSRPAGYPVNEPCYGSGNAFEYGGDGGTPEVGLAALEHFYYTQDSAALARFLPLATLAATFYTKHYSTDATGNLYIFPTGVTEYNWCAWNTTAGAPSDDCCANDLPTVAGVTQLLEQLLTVLPANATTTEQRAEWAALLATVPPLPTAPLPGNGTTALAHAARLCSSGTNNVETPELYAVHPYRRLTVGRALGDLGPGAAGVQALLAPAVASFYADPNALSNHDWTQSVFDAALLGLASDAARLVTERALSPPAPGYTWPGFAPAIYDYAPVSEHYSGMVSAVNWMLLQPGDDARGSMALLPAWPCEWSVRFKLWGPLNTTVELDYAPGLRRVLTVTPAARLRDVTWAGCGP